MPAVRPPIAQDDILPSKGGRIGPGEGAGDVDGNVLANDRNPDGIDVRIVEVGDGGRPGTAVAGSDGGLFRIGAGGQLDFDANGDFDDLAPGETRTTTINYTIAFEGTASATFDLMLLQDLSGSFSDDVVNVNSQFPAVMDEFQAGYDAQFGVASFVDKPYNFFGYGSDYAYRTDLAVTPSTEAVSEALDDLVVLGGGDGPEAQLEALLQLAKRAETDEIGYRDGAQRLVVLTTDAGYHQEGDFDVLNSTGRPVPDNDGDGVLELEDYPSVEAVAAALRAANITPIFAVTSYALPEYQALVDAFGFGVAVELTSDSSNLADAIRLGLGEAGGQSTAQVSVTVTRPEGDGENTPPALVLDPLTRIQENGAVVLSGLARDADKGETLTLFVNWGDGSPLQKVVVRENGVGDNSFRVAHIFRDDQPGDTPDRYNITVTLRDDDGAAVRKEAVAFVDNADPVLGGETRADVPDSGISTSKRLAFKGVFEDAGRRDGHSLTIKWGDGTVSHSDDKAFKLFEDVAGLGRFTAEHFYAEGGIYNLAAILRDEDGGRDGMRQKVYVSGMRLTDKGELQVVSDDRAAHVVIHADRGGLPGGEDKGGLAPIGRNLLDVETSFFGGYDETFQRTQVERVVFRGSDYEDVVLVQSDIGSAVTLEGRGGGDDLRGGEMGDHIKGNRGADDLYGQMGSDTVTGGLGNDRVFGDFDAASGSGNDVVRGKGGNDIVLGGGGSDIVEGNNGRDWVAGGFGDDTVSGGNGHDVMFGDHDRFEGPHPDVSGNGAPPRFVPSGETPTAVTRPLDGDDHMDGGLGDDLIFGQGGNDTINAGEGDDTVSGGRGDDLVTLGPGADVLVFDAGDGDDVVVDFGPADTIDLTGLDRAFIADGGDVLDRADQVGGDVVLDLGGGDSIRLEGVSLSDLSEGDFWV